MSLAERIFFEAYHDGWRPDPVLTVSEWADQYRQLSSATSAEPANWRTSRTPYLREIQDTLSAHHPAQRIVFIKGAQLGGTEAGLNWIGYSIQCAPGPMMMVQPRVEDAENVSKERIAPMLVLTPALADLVSENRSRDGDNTILVKKFRGGLLAITGANSATGLRARPIGRLFFDEVDAYPEDVDGEGDPIALAEKRTTTFRRRKILMVSTPTIKDRSRIEKEWLASDQRHYFVPCPHCGNFDWMRWSSIDYRNDDPETATLLCGACGVLIEERYKTEMLAAGEWRSTVKDEDRGRARSVGFHLSSLYSPLGWLSWSDIVAEHLASKNDPTLRKTWVNTRLAETWEERTDKVDPDTLLKRANERYDGDVPAGVGVLVASVDVQMDRLEWKVKGYGAGEESWLIGYGQIAGNPSLQATWLDLDQVLLQDWKHESGQSMRVACVAVDSRYKADMVYRFCRARLDRRVFAVRGGNTIGQPLVGRPKADSHYRARVFTLCVDTGKDTVHSRMRIGVPGPGFMHLPEWVDAEYVAQLTAERPFRKFMRGRGSVRQWEKIRDRNEAFDLEVYCLAALHILGQPFIRTLAVRAARYASPTLKLDGQAREPGGEPVAPPSASEKPPAGKGRRPGRNWATGGKRWRV